MNVQTLRSSTKLDKAAALALAIEGHFASGKVNPNVCDFPSLSVRQKRKKQASHETQKAKVRGDDDVNRLRFTVDQKRTLMHAAQAAPACTPKTPPNEVESVA